MKTADDASTFTREIRIAARPETVFAFFTDPEKMIRWKGRSATLDPRPGGIYRVEINERHIARGEYVEIVPHRRVVFTWGWEEEGNQVPPGSSTVEVTLVPDGEGTILRLVHRHLPDAARAPHAHGWEHYLDRLTTAAAGSDPGPIPGRPRRRGNTRARTVRCSWTSGHHNLTKEASIMPRVVHFELSAEDPDRAARFYGQVFGWRFEKWSGPMEYWMVNTEGDKQPGINGGLSRRRAGAPANTVNTIDVPSVDEYSTKVGNSGGKVIAPKMAIPGVGYFAMCQDTEGTTFGIMQFDEKAK